MLDFTTYILGIVATLISIGIVGIWSVLNKLGNSLSALQATVSAWTKVFEDRFVVITDIGHDHEKRLGSIEGKTELNHQLIRGIEDRCKELKASYPSKEINIDGSKRSDKTNS